MRLYEAIFIVDGESGEEALKEAERGIREMLQRRGAEVLSLERWEARKLAYPIKKRMRGVYYIAHFNAPADAIAETYRDAMLSETILRTLIVRDEDGVQVPGEPAEKGEANAELQ